MKLSLSRDTLAYQMGMRPALQFRDMSKVPLKEVIAAMLKFEGLSNLYDWVSPAVKVSGPSEPVKGSPEKDALTFYMLNHAVSMIRQRVHPLEPLGKYHSIVEDFHLQLSLRSARMFYYLLLICTREARHSNGPKGKYEDVMVKTHGQAVVDFHSTIMSIGETDAVNKLRKHPPEVTLGCYVSYMADQFYKHSYASSFGGPAWGKVADTLRDFVLGKITAEMMMDTAFTLAHNTGPIFNKGMLFDHQNNSALGKILDVQRSGQIPYLVSEGGVTGIDKFVSDMHFRLSTILPLTGEVDWHLVESLGSVHKYPQEKDKQDKKHGVVKMVPKSKMSSGIGYFSIEGSDLNIQIIPGSYIKKVASPRKSAW